MTTERKIDRAEVEFALDDLAGIADLLNDAAYSGERDPGRRGVSTAAGYLFEIHKRLSRALGFEMEDAQ